MSEAKLYTKSGGFKRGTFVILEAGPFTSPAQAELFMREVEEMWTAYCAAQPPDKVLPPLAKTGQIEQGKTK